MTMAGLFTPISTPDSCGRTRSRSTGPAKAPTVLFVDDDEHVLDGLRTVLRRRVKDCTMAFVPGPLEALEYLDHHSVDLVVADLKMPAMNGVELLEAIRVRHPTALRYVLSGEAGLEVVTEAVPVVHRLMTKPCDSDDLAEVISRALFHRRLDLADDPDARLALAATSALPSPPGIYTELRRLLADHDVPLDDVAALVSTDPAVTAKLLQWANSASIGRPGVSDVKRAIGRVGLEPMAKLVLSASVVRVLTESDTIPGLDAEQLVRTSQTISTLAARLARPEEAIDASVAGVLSSVGLLLEAAALPNRLHHAYRQAEAEDRTLADVERELYGHAHPDLAVHLLTIWGLPVELVTLVGLADQPPRLDQPPPWSGVEAVRVARLLTLHDLGDPSIGRPHLDRIAAAELDRMTELAAGRLAATEPQEPGDLS